MARVVFLYYCILIARKKLAKQWVWDHYFEAISPPSQGTISWSLCTPPRAYWIHCTMSRHRWCQKCPLTWNVLAMEVTWHRTNLDAGHGCGSINKTKLRKTVSLSKSETPCAFPCHIALAVGFPFCNKGRDVGWHSVRNWRRSWAIDCLWCSEAISNRGSK